MISFIISSLIIFLLFVFSERANHKPNGFIRLFRPHSISARQVLDLEFNSYYISGITEKSIYLGNQTTPAYVYSFDHQLKNTQKYRLIIPPKINFSRGAIIATVDSPCVYLTDYKNSLILSGEFPGLKFRLLDDSTQFFRCKPVSSMSFILQTDDILNNQNVIFRKDYDSSGKFYSSVILDKNREGVILKDGSLLFDKVIKRLFYVYYYNNQFLCIDTNFNLIYNGRTIDSISKPHVKLSMINGGRDITMSAPPLLVNRDCCTNGKWLFIHSGLLANNEMKQSFEQNSVIDVYDLNTGRYTFSFYVPDFRKGKLKSFQVFHEELIVLYDAAIYIYHFNY